MPISKKRLEEIKAFKNTDFSDCPELTDEQLAQMIFKRQSVRAYSRTSVDFLDNDIDLAVSLGIQPLIKDIRVKVKVLRKAEVSNNRSDYCIAFYSEEKPYHLENIGFIGQQIELTLQSKGLGTCWWGMKKPKKNFKSADGLNSIITMTVGYPKTPETRKYPDGFKRKNSADILIKDSKPDNLIEAVRIAPSAINLQPWLIEKNDNSYNFYLKTPGNLLEKMINDMRHIDIGIAMAHLFVQAKADGINISFNFEGADITNGKFICSAVLG
ncbi:MAG: hypothetical protein FWD14_05185 [Treponema sp.]|nr:hypothetical protein [Treponema sp.]